MSKKDGMKGECNCSGARILTGEGCQYCQPQKYIVKLRKRIVKLTECLVDCNSEVSQERWNEIVKVIYGN